MGSKYLTPFIISVYTIGILREKIDREKRERREKKPSTTMCVVISYHLKPNINSQVNKSTCQYAIFAFFAFFAVKIFFKSFV